MTGACAPGGPAPSHPGWRRRPPGVGPSSPWVGLTIADATPVLPSRRPQRLAGRAARAHRGRAPRAAVPRLPRRRPRAADRRARRPRRARERRAAAPATTSSLPWDTEVSRLHAELECDRRRVDGQRRRPVAQRHVRQRPAHQRPPPPARRRRDPRRAHLDRLPAPRARRTREPTQIAGQRLALGDLPPTQRQVLVALARPYKHDEFAIPATNGDIAGELHLSVDAVKSHLRALFGRFGIEHLPQNQKRSRLVAEALQSGVLSTRDL